MARTSAEIEDSLDDDQAAQSGLAGLTSTSQTSIFGLWKSLFARAGNYLEQLWDQKQAALEAVLAAGTSPSNAWVRTKAFEFQYDATTPQTMSLNTDPTLPNYLVPVYDTVDESKRIITRCTVTTSAGVCAVYVAKSDPPVKLSAPELASIQGYFTNTGNGTDQAVGLGFAGQVISLFSLDPDLLFLEGTITYSGAYAGTIEDACKLAITEYISELGSNPKFVTNEMIARLRAVPGFVNIHIEELDARTALQAFGAGTVLINAGDWAADSYTAAAGYMIEETTAGQTFTAKITFTAV